jgi:ABC-type transport system substrate-binding protein
VRSAHLSGGSVTVWIPSVGVTQGRFVAHLLDSIGLRAQVKPVKFKKYFDQIFDPATHAQIGYDNWIADYPSVAGFLPAIFSCAGNASQFCNHGIDRLFAKAEAEDPAAALPLWQKAQRAIFAQAPIVPADNGEDVAFLAKRVRSFQSHPEWGVLLDQLWVR